MPVNNSQHKTLVFGDALQVIIFDENSLDYPRIGSLLKDGDSELVLSKWITASLKTGQIVLRGYKISDTAYIVTEASKEVHTISFEDLNIKKEKVLETVEYLYHLATVV